MLPFFEDLFAGGCRFSKIAGTVTVGFIVFSDAGDWLVLTLLLFFISRAIGGRVLFV